MHKLRLTSIHIRFFSTLHRLSAPKITQTRSSHIPDDTSSTWARRQRALEDQYVWDHEKQVVRNLRKRLLDEAKHKLGDGEKKIQVEAVLEEEVLLTAGGDSAGRIELVRKLEEKNV